MAEIVCKVNAGAGYEDGDVLEAFNDRRIGCVHAEHICHPWKAGVNRDGWRPLDHVSRQWYELTHQYRFERTGTNTAKRIVIATAQEEDVSATMDVALYLARRKSFKAPDGGPKKAVFGPTGAEIWYGGRVDVSPAKVDAVWSMIEARTANRRTDLPLWPAGTQDLKSHLFLKVDDFNDSSAQVMVEPERDAEGNVLRKRQWRVSYSVLTATLDVSLDAIRDKAMTVDVRAVPLTRSLIVEAK